MCCLYATVYERLQAINRYDALVMHIDYITIPFTRYPRSQFFVYVGI